MSDEFPVPQSLGIDYDQMIEVSVEATNQHFRCERDVLYSNHFVVFGEIRCNTFNGLDEPPISLPFVRSGWQLLYQRRVEVGVEGYETDPSFDQQTNRVFDG